MFIGDAGIKEDRGGPIKLSDVSGKLRACESRQPIIHKEQIEAFRLGERQCLGARFYASYLIERAGMNRTISRQSKSSSV